jgi:hypothetical protein
MEAPAAKKPGFGINTYSVNSAPSPGAFILPTQIGNRVFNRGE